MKTPYAILEQLVSLGEVGEGNDLKIGAFMRGMQDAANYHLHREGITVKHIMDVDMAFILTRLVIEIYDLPSNNGVLSFKTWHKGKKGISFLRDFIITCDGKEVAKASTSWVLLDTKTKTILRPKVFPYDLSMYEMDSGVVFEKEPFPEDLTFFGNRTIVYSDLDSNGHVNNAKYGDIITDVLFAHSCQKKIEQLDIHFLSEAKKGAEMGLWLKELDNTAYIKGMIGSTKCFTAKVALKEIDGAE